ncbi:MAG: hypothetical protein LBG78_10445 [Azoarcus sp.]|jgi:hypothetical protein|nr:hypothetical protein [Azoarcus sp.]
MLKISCLLLIALLVGCSSSPSKQKPASAISADIPADKAARIRLFGQNGMVVRFYRNSTCNRGRAETVSGGLGSALSSFVGVASNESIGMPETPNVKNIAERSGILSKAYFREYTVEAGQPLTVTQSYRDVSGWYCSRASAITFIPEAGKDYEAAFDNDVRSGFCGASIKQIVTQDNEVALLPVEVSRPFCERRRGRARREPQSPPVQQTETPSESDMPP